MLSKIYWWLWATGVTPQGFLRLLPAPVAAAVARMYTSRQMGCDEPAVSEYLLAISRRRGSGEYANNTMLSPGPYARLPLADRLAATGVRPRPNGQSCQRRLLLRSLSSPSSPSSSASSSSSSSSSFSFSSSSSPSSPLVLLVPTTCVLPNAHRLCQRLACPVSFLYGEAECPDRFDPEHARSLLRAGMLPAGSTLSVVPGGDHFM